MAQGVLKESGTKRRTWNGASWGCRLRSHSSAPKPQAISRTHTPKPCHVLEASARKPAPLRSPRPDVGLVLLESGCKPCRPSGSGCQQQFSVTGSSCLRIERLTVLGPEAPLAAVGVADGLSWRAIRKGRWCRGTRHCRS